MAHIQIQCQNCGAKYKIPETFKSDTARCKQCGTMIDVTAQRQAAAEETPEEETAAPSSASRSEEKSHGRSRRGGGRSSRRRSSRRRGREDQEDEQEAEKPHRGARAAAGGRRRGHRAEDDDDGEEHGGRPRRQRKKDPTPIVVGAVIGVLAIVTVLLVYNYWDEVAGKVKLPGQEDKYAAAQKQKAEEDEKEMQRRIAAAEAEQERLNTEAAEKRAAAKKAKEAAARKKKVLAKAKTLEDVFDPSTLAKVPWSDAVKEDRRKELDELVATAMESGLPGIRAQRKLEDIGWAALVPLTNKILTFDYKTTKGNNDAFMLGAIVERITGWDPQLAVMTEGDKIEPKIAHDNAVGIYQLHIKMTKYWTTEDGLSKWRKKNVK
ncbi:MAG: zinc ribbon domain-containing protein [Planctomycetota bacterium]|jgi:hypothetical protein